MKLKLPTDTQYLYQNFVNALTIPNTNTNILKDPQQYQYQKQYFKNTPILSNTKSHPIVLLTSDIRLCQLLIFNCILLLNHYRLNFTIRYVDVDDPSKLPLESGFTLSSTKCIANMFT